MGAGSVRSGYLSLMKRLLILNPEAGRLRDEPELRLRLTHHPLLREGEAHLPASANDARLLAHRGADEGRDLVIAAGGDGTVHAVVNGLMSADEGGGPRPTLAVVPLGTANDLARTLGLPDDPVEALKLMERGPRHPLDLIRIRVDGASESRWAVNAVTGGVTAKAEGELLDEAKDTWGPLAYLRTGLGALPDLSEYRILVRIDDRDTEEADLLSFVVANGRFAGGGIPVAADARPDDGLLDVTLIPGLPVPELASVATAILRGRVPDHEDVRVVSARRVHLGARPPVWLSLDGELVRAAEAELTVEPAALTVVTGPSFPTP